MKKYITPAVEVQNVTLQAMMAVSFKVNEGSTGDQLSRDNNWDIWDDDEDI